MLGLSREQISLMSLSLFEGQAVASLSRVSNFLVSFPALVQSDLDLWVSESAFG